MYGLDFIIELKADNINAISVGIEAGC